MHKMLQKQEGGDVCLQEINRLSRGSAPEEKIVLSPTFYGKYRVLAVLAILLGVIIAAFAVSGVWLERGWPEDPLMKEEGALENTTTEPATPPETMTKDAPEEPFPLPDGTAVRAMDLSYPSRGENYLWNETSYRPLLEDIRERRIYASEASRSSGGPLVLILHTHTTEAYLPEVMERISGDLGDATYSKDPERNLISIGRALTEALNRKGIPSIHCTVVHNGDSLINSYRRAAESIQFYLSLYPSIEYVIDLHRDAIVTSDGEYVRTIAAGCPEATAQIMPVVGVGEMTENATLVNDNLALALRLRDLLNRDDRGLGRPVALKNASYNQELARHSLLLEIGAGGNTVEEALRVVPYLADALELLILPQ